MQTSCGGISLFPHGMGQLPSWKWMSLMLMIGNCTQTRLALLVVAHFGNAPGFTTNGSPINARLFKTVSIQWQELFAILAAALTWGHRWRNKRIKFHCDNQAIVFAWQGKNSKQPKLMSLRRRLFPTAAFTVTLHHLPGKLNSIADALSRQQFTRFFSLAPQADPKPTPGVLRTL